MEKALVNSPDSNNSDTTLLDWVQVHNSEDELRSIFLNMDRALKYIHEHGYCIAVFYPTEISVLNNEDDYIKFNHLRELSSDVDEARNEIKEDLFRSSFIQISVYSNTIWNMKNINDWEAYLDFLKDNFDSFAEFLPKDDVPYYRGIIQRGASVYYCEYSQEKSKRDLEELKKEFGGVEELPPTTDNDENLTNKKVNDIIYKNISGISEAAFLNILIIPVVVLIIFVLFMFAILILNFTR